MTTKSCNACGGKSRGRRGPPGPPGPPGPSNYLLKFSGTLPATAVRAQSFASDASDTSSANPIQYPAAVPFRATRLSVRVLTALPQNAAITFQLTRDNVLVPGTAVVATAGSPSVAVSFSEDYAEDQRYDLVATSDGLVGDTRFAAGLAVGAV